MDSQTQSHEDILVTLNDLVIKTYQNENSPPFFGLLGIPDEHRIRAKATIISLTKGDENLVLSYLDKYFYLAVWYLCDAVRSSYGSDGTVKVWPIISKSVGIHDNLTQNFRDKIHNTVSKTCVNLGLPVPLERNISVFLLHAGVATPQLHHLIKAFLTLERYSGLPDIEDGNQTKSWELQALELLPTGVRVLRAPIEWDMSSWHAGVFINCQSENKSSMSEYHNRFTKIINKITNEGQGKILSRVSLPKPKLVLENREIKLKIPDGTRRVRVRYDNETTLRIRSGETISLPSPLPKKIEFLDSDYSINVLSKSGQALVGDLELEEKLIEVRDSDSLNFSNIVVFSRDPIGRIDGELNCQEISREFYSTELELSNHKPTRLLIGDRPLVLNKKVYRRITMGEGIIGRSSKGFLHSVQATLRISTGIQEKIKWLVGIQLGNSPRKIFKIHTDCFGEAKLKVSDILQEFNDYSFNGPTILLSEIMLLQSKGDENIVGSGVRARSFIWPEFLRVNNGELVCKTTPKNLSKEQCSNIIIHEGNNPIIDENATSEAIIAFEINNEIVQFKLPPQDLHLELITPEGVSRPLPVGTKIVLNSETNGGAIRVSSHDPEAELEIPNKNRFRPFHKGQKYSIGLRGLDSGLIQLHRNNGISLQLVELQNEFIFSEVNFVLGSNSTSISLTLPDDPISLKVIVESEIDIAKKAGEIHFGPEKYLERPPDWLSASKDPITRVLEISVNLKNISVGEWYGIVFVKYNSGWGQLVSESGQKLTFLVHSEELLSPTIQTAKRAEKLDRWLTTKHSQESWGKGGLSSLNSIKSDLIKALDEQLGGREKIIQFSLSDQWFQNDKKWFPGMFGVIDCPLMFESKLSDFLGVGGPYNALSRLQTIPLRENNLIEVSALMGFKNALNADKTGEKLKDFTIERFLETITIKDEKLYHNWDGKTVLGLPHWKSAHTLLQDRVDVCGFFGEENTGKLNNRSHNISKIMNKIDRLTNDIPIPSNVDENQEPLHQFFTNCFRSLAVACRSNQTFEWLEELSNRSKLSKILVLRSLGDMIKLGPELFAFHLLLAELEKR